MSVASRPVATGKTRTCPHCKATILESLSICPGCMHHLRFDSEAAKRQVAAAPALRVEGIIRHPPLDQPQEYFVIIAIRNDRGEEITRQVVGVGALQPAEKRTFSLSVEVLPPLAPPATKGQPAAAAAKAPAGALATAAPVTNSPPASPPAPAGAAGSMPQTFATTPPPAAGNTGTTGSYPAPGAAASNPNAPGTGTVKAPAAPAVTPPPAASGNPTSAQPPKASYPGGLKPPTPGSPKPPMPGGFKKH